MSLVDELLGAPDEDAVRRLVGEASPDDLGRAVEPLAAEVLRLLRVDARRAYDVAERVEMLADAVPEPQVRARARWIKGHVFWGVSRLHEALDCYRDAARAYRELGRKQEVTRIAIGQSNALAWLGRYREALEVGRQARRALLRQGDAAAAARMDHNLGNVHHWSGQPRRALVNYDRALRFARRTKDAAMVRMVQMNRATQLSALGQLDRAESLFREVREGAKRAGEWRHRAVADYNLGYILFRRGDYGAAWDTLDEARRAFEELGDDLYLAGTLVDLTELLVEVNDFRRAFRLAGEARVLAERLGLAAETGRSTLLQAAAVLAMGGAGEARPLLEEARATFREAGHPAARALAEMYLAEVWVRDGELGEASRLLRRAVAAYRKEGMRLHAAAASLALASAQLAAHRPGSARTALDAAAAILRRVPSPWLRARLAHLRGRVSEAEGRPGEALRHFRRAVERIESIRGRIGIDEFRVSFTEDKAPVYADLVRAILARGGRRAVEDAFAAVERARSRALVDLLAGRLRPAASTADAATRRLLERVETLRAEINRLSGFDDSLPGRRARFRPSGASTTQLRDREALLTETLRRLERRDARLGALAVGETMTLRETQHDLPADTCVVEYFLGAEASWAFVVRRDGARVVDLPIGADEVTRRVAQLRFQIEKSGYGEEYVRAREELLRRSLARHLDHLAAAVWEPLEVKDRRVVVIPHGALHALPFAALPLSDGRQVLDHHVLSFLPSASCRRYLRKKVRARPPEGEPGPRLLAVEVGDEGIPEVQREIRGIRRVFPRSRILAHRRATRDRFRAAAADADIVHIAAHAVFRGDDPAFSALRMADGWMSLHDVYGLRLDASLVCLSACQTGRSLVRPGDEMVGLSRGFLYAGARALLASLWPVPDGSTADLMIAFYRELRGGQPADESLRRAMRASRDRTDHPYHWAPFVLIGES